MRYATPSYTRIRKYIVIVIAGHVLVLIILFTLADHQDGMGSGMPIAPELAPEPAQVTLYHEPQALPTPALTAPTISSELQQETPEIPEVLVPAPIQRTLPARSGRSSWYKRPPTQVDTQAIETASDSPPQTAQQLAQEFSKVSRHQRRTAEAVYNLTDAQSHANAQLREIMDGRFRHQVVLALHAASLENHKPFHSYKNLHKKIDIKIILDVQGKILAVEFVQSTGYPELDAYIVDLIKLVKKFPRPKGRDMIADGCYAINIPTEVTCDATTQVLGFTYSGGGDYFG